MSIRNRERHLEINDVLAVIRLKSVCRSSSALTSLPSRLRRMAAFAARLVTADLRPL